MNIVSYVSVNNCVSAAVLTMMNDVLVFTLIIMMLTRRISSVVIKPGGILDLGIECLGDSNKIYCCM